MIVADLEHLTEQAASSEGLTAALDFLRTVGPETPDGRVEVDGTAVYALVQSYQTRAETDRPTFEAHRKYVDVQYVVSGKETLGWAPLDLVTVSAPYDEEKDALLGFVPVEERTFLRFTSGQAIVLFPTDAHAPGLAAGRPEAVKKVVVKIAIES